MAACDFTISFTGTATDFTENIKTKVQTQGGTFNGDEGSGNFSLSLFGSTISGGYTIQGTDMNIIIDQKPFLISCNQIQKYLENNL
jgi:hypothetical protein